MSDMITFNEVTFGFNGAPELLFNKLTKTCELFKLSMIVGRNGSGKSTFLKLFKADQSLLHARVSGSFEAFGKSYTFLSQEHVKFVHEHIGYVDQKFDLLLAPHLTFQENLACAKFTHYPLFFSSVKTEESPEIVREFNIPFDQPVSLLSGGQRQILAILMSLQKNPAILLLDEPTAALDSKNAHMVMQFLVKLVEQEKVTVLMVCHDTELYSYASGASLILS